MLPYVSTSSLVRERSYASTKTVGDVVQMRHAVWTFRCACSDPRLAGTEEVVINGDQRQSDMSATGEPLTTGAGETDSVLELPHADTTAPPSAAASSRHSANASLDPTLARVLPVVTPRGATQMLFARVGPLEMSLAMVPPPWRLGMPSP